MLRNQPGGLPILVSDRTPDAGAPEKVRLSELVPERPTRLQSADGQVLVVVLSDGRPRAFASRCPHLGGDLGEARCVGRRGDLVCAWHGYLFNGETGAFLENPNTSPMSTVRKASEHFDPGHRPSYRLREYTVETDGTFVWAAGGVR